MDMQGQIWACQGRYGHEGQIQAGKGRYGHVSADMGMLGQIWECYDK